MDLGKCSMTPYDSIGRTLSRSRTQGDYYDLIIGNEVSIIDKSLGKMPFFDKSSLAALLEEPFLAEKEVGESWSRFTLGEEIKEGVVQYRA